MSVAISDILPARWGIGHSAWQLQYLLAAEQTQAGHQDQVEEQHHGDGQDATLGCAAKVATW